MKKPLLIVGIIILLLIAGVAYYVIFPTSNQVCSAQEDVLRKELEKQGLDEGAIETSITETFGSREECIEDHKLYRQFKGAVTIHKDYACLKKSESIEDLENCTE